MWSRIGGRLLHCRCSREECIKRLIRLKREWHPKNTKRGAWGLIMYPPMTLSGSKPQDHTKRGNRDDLYTSNELNESNVSKHSADTAYTQSHRRSHIHIDTVTHT